MISKKVFEIFKNGSRTYFFSSLFFPKKVREDVFHLYGFVRVADDLVDCTPQKPKEFADFVTRFNKSWKNNSVNDEVISPFVKMAKRVGIEKKNIDSFLESMRSDLHKSKYSSLQETIEYMHGSAEVIGLMMSRIMGLPSQSDKYAMLLGRAMQYANFIRDISIDNSLGRQYLPTSFSKKHGLKDLTFESYIENKTGFNNFIQEQIQQFETWQKEAGSGFHFIPKRFRIPIKTASDMYVWTINEIKKDPSLVFRKQMKPETQKVVASGIKNSITAFIWE